MVNSIEYMFILGVFVENFRLICWPDECTEMLSIPSGTLAIQDPAMGPNIDIQIGHPSSATITYLLDERDVVALELRLQPARDCEHFERIGVVGVDSAKIVFGDKINIENCPDSVLFLSTLPEKRKVFNKIVKRFKLNTRRVIDRTAEVVTDDCEKLSQQISNYISSELHLNPSEYVFLHSEDGFWERCCEAGWDGGFFDIGDSRAFLLNTGGDGRFDVVGGYSDDTIVKIWLLINDQIFTDGRIQYSSKPLETRPPRKPPSPEFIAMMRAALKPRRAKPWWKFW